MKLRVNGEPYDGIPGLPGELAILSDDQFEIEIGTEVVPVTLTRQGERVWVTLAGRQYVVERDKTWGQSAQTQGDGQLRASMPAQVVEVMVSAGDTVEAGQKVVVIEAMKMQQTLTAPAAGTVAEVNAKAGDQVTEGYLLVKIDVLASSEDGS